MQHGAVLDVGICSDPDRVDVAAHHRVHPDTRVLTQGDIANKLRGCIDIAASGNNWGVPLVRTDHEKPRLPKLPNPKCTSRVSSPGRQSGPRESPADPPIAVK